MLNVEITPETPRSRGGSDFVETIRTCLEIETVAYKFYSGLAKASETSDPGMAAFWRSVAVEEWTYIAFWDRALSFAEKGLLPHIFDKPREMLDELLNIAGKMIEILSEIDACAKSPTTALLMAFRIEFFSIHSALVPTINLMKAIGQDVSAYDSFDSHLQSFISVFKSKVGALKPEMQLLGETIQRLWRDNLRLSRECYFDELTGLLNRRGFYNAALPLLNLAKRKQSPVAALMIDIDHFKRVNDSFGHQTGDIVLQEVGSLLKSVLRDSDLSARFGGEEFLVLCPEVTPGGAMVVAEKIRATVEAPAGGLKAQVTVSLGAVETLLPRDSNCEEDLAALIKAADALLYAAKRNGRNRTEGKTLETLDAEMAP